MKNIKKEVRPEETVSMERYYFGQIGGNGEFKKTAIAVEVSSFKIAHYYSVAEQELIILLLLLILYLFTSYFIPTRSRL